MNTSPTVFPRERSNSLNMSLWIVQGLLAALFLMSGSAKILMPPINGFSVVLFKFIGTVEVLGALGLLLPSITRIKPILTPLAATGLGIIMILATIFHISKGEAKVIGITIFIGALACFVAWGRFTKAQIQPK